MRYAGICVALACLLSRCCVSDGVADHWGGNDGAADHRIGLMVE